jgi:uncharacterized RDD family membrane protein YckC
MGEPRDQIARRQRRGMPALPAAARAPVALVCAVMVTSVAGAQDTAPESARPPPEVRAAGDARLAWLVFTDREELAGGGSRQPRPRNRFAWRRESGEARFQRVPVPPELGRIVGLAAAGSNLHAFFDDGTHHSYWTGGREIELTLPGRTVPRAVAGLQTPAGTNLYAVVPHGIGRIVRKQAAERVSDTRPATAPATPPKPNEWYRAPPQARPTPPESPPSAPQPGTPAAPATRGASPETQAEPDLTPDTALDLIAYRGARWDFVATIDTLPDDVSPDRLRLAATPDAVCVFWPADSIGDAPTALHFVRYTDEAWTTPATLRLDGPAVRWEPLYVPPRLTIVAAVAAAGSTRASPPDDTKETPGAADRVTWRGWYWAEGAWRAAAPLAPAPEAATEPGTDARKPFTPRPDRATIAAFGQNILIAATDDAGAVFVGIWPAKGGAPKQPFTETAAFELPRAPVIAQRTRDWLGLLIVMALIVLVFWRRQDSLSTPAALPQGWMLAQFWKRLAAAILDLLPAAAVTAWIWYEPALAYWTELKNVPAWTAENVPGAPARLLVGWLVARLIYAAYCGGFEWYWGTSPGKWMLGCRVFSETGQAPAPIQIAIRNAVRIVELEPLLQIWPLLLIAVLTRNRQRLGDLLARTLVAEPEPGTAPEDTDDKDEP